MSVYSHQRDFMFCECGAFLSLDSIKYAHCPACKNRVNMKDIIGKEISYTISAEAIRREFGISSSFDDFEEEKELKQMDYNAKCKVCQYMGMAYVARQIRSADEGQTIFYTCTQCGNKQTENS
ncbi:unnamed protein product [Cuscuta europaea]|uniref:DNA-directed RNA polymerase subunit n=1 Tax=Cuscuta europaea TaxID=41803 RepID=A0A9P1EHW9_CUSEU|nr:unnamed protein product [Cuscuta europaea]